ncbi:hypothetical protein P148_SR1C00001G0268 [candidate division SR1 bacterium RAAC1_SR1_1]|nr:hypothetical protein P148_SR1C00001G0268 [candidate division SR1 bacterium RAAC1_SR1_1]
MNIEEKANNQSLKIQLSLASLMFFSPFITHLLKGDSLELNEQDRLFVQGYISLGWINLILVGLALLSGLFSYFYTIDILTIIYQVIVGILVALLGIGCIGAITEIKIIKKTSLSNKSEFTEYTNLDKAHSFLAYLPGYSVYLRYMKHSFDTPDILIKESLILWILFGISCLAPTPFFAVFIGIVILVRIVTLLGNIDIIPKSISEFVSSLFYKNPEEIWGYVWGSIVFLFHGNYNRPYWKLLVENIKNEYQYLYDIKKFGSIQRQYGLLLICIIILLWQVDLGHISGLAILTVLLVLVRYSVMLWIWGRSPALPLMRELVLLITTIIKPFTSKKS